ncbi:uncharacterized protein LOC106173796 [Lingula anatina]|uniref:Uncharacterized protein LOC106173796 n=1 Tax=Lingula anatina TaxID=7574 RepID=A0A1S3JKQ8_LINAN|nr:uncharacterized protein LOC106173796 [Lingula anatina]|eukprot:XP_013410489.1 uncharacterized protein LOC106173796 [Lingula anatina]
MVVVTLQTLFTGIHLVAALSFPVSEAMAIIGTFVIPHGGIALNPSYFNTTNETAKQQAWEVHKACMDIGHQISEKKPDVIFLSTPHGVSDLSRFAFYMNPTGHGFADTDNCACPPCCYELTANFDVNTTNGLLKNLSGQKFDVTGLSAFGPPGESNDAFPLRWAEVIPLSFIKDLKNMKIVVISQPSKRYTESVKMIPELLMLGQKLYQELEELADKKVVVIISADLAHTHSEEGPYGYSNASEPFDKACGTWASTLQPEALLKTAANYVDEAKSCGYTGLVMLQGMLQAAGLDSWTHRLLVNYHPSYYGMMVAEFLPRKV